MDIFINTPLTEEKTSSLKAGDRLFLTGTIYTARDAAHKRLIESIKNEEALPFVVKESIIYHVGPSPEKPGSIIGSAGPTTSSRMDAYSPLLIESGLKGMIGKGLIGKEVIKSIIKHKAVYFGAIGGAAALMARCIKNVELIAYEDLGSEAIRKLQVEKMPLFVIVDSCGDSLYDFGPRQYLESIE